MASMFKIEEEIQLTKNGDFLQSSKELREYYTPRTIGYHKYCDSNRSKDSFMYLHRTSKQKNTIFCKKCNFRIEIPLKVNNFKKIKKYFENRFDDPIDRIQDRSEILDL